MKEYALVGGATRCKLSALNTSLFPLLGDLDRFAECYGTQQVAAQRAAHDSYLVRHAPTLCRGADGDGPICFSFSPVSSVSEPWVWFLGCCSCVLPKICPNMQIMVGLKVAAHRDTRDGPNLFHYVTYPWLGKNINEPLQPTEEPALRVWELGLGLHLSGSGYSVILQGGCAAGVCVFACLIFIQGDHVHESPSTPFRVVLASFGKTLGPSGSRGAAKKKKKGRGPAGGGDE